MSDSRAIVFLDEVKSTAADLVLQPGANLYTGIKPFASAFSRPTSLEDDLLVVASTIFACDLAFKRGERENISRSIEVTVPVVNLQAFERVKNILEYFLFVLSHDSWTFNFERAKGTPEGTNDWPKGNGKTLLFSGGLDSLAGAVDLIDELGPENVQLASHITANLVTKSSQDQLADYLTKKYKKAPQRIVVRTGGRNHKSLTFPADSDREETQRTRSFMFLTIAALAARRTGHSKLVMIAENGQMAIHLPLSAARIGAFSTHTAHPEFVAQVSEFFTQLLEYPITIENPYLYRTKGEVVEKLASSHQSAVAISVSCWRGSRLGKSFNHCGQCIPCLIRRIALERHNLVLAEYERDLLVEDLSSLPPTDEGKRNLADLGEFAYAFSTQTDSELLFSYVDLINEHIDVDASIAMYRRFANEASTVFGKYPNVAAFIGLHPTPSTSRNSKISKRGKKIR
jgi:7-cyano-7-deazaguanine synthase in queuosine biosynthesis